MSLIDLFLQRRRRSWTCRPAAEVLEERECLSVAAPTGLQLSALSSTQVKLTWNNVPGELGFDIYEWNGTKSVLLTNVPKGQTTFTASGLTPAQTYYFSVSAFDQTGSAESAWASIVTPADAITAPANFHVVGVTQTQVNLAWTPVTGATGYSVYGWNGTAAFLIGSTTPSVPAFTVNNLMSGVTYYFYVKAVNATNSASTAWVSATTTSTGIAAPGNVKATVVNPTTIALSWTNVANELGYRVFRWNGITTSAPVLIATLAANTTGYQAIGLAPGTAYSFYVQAYNSTAFANSAWVTASTTVPLPLQAPTQFTVSVTGAESVSLSWAASAGADGYRIAIWTGTYWSLADTVAAGTHTATLNNLAPGHSYYFMIEAYADNFAEVAYSNIVLANL